MEEETNYFNVLNCHVDASEEELKAQYQKLILKYHPDKASDDSV